MATSISAGESVSTPAGGESVSVNVYGFIALALVIGVILLIWASYAGGGQMATPRYERIPEDVFEGINHILMVPGDLGDMSTNHEWKQPDYDTLQNVKMAVRYPARSGNNISAIIHKGWSPMMRPAAKDGDWIEKPPTNAGPGSTYCYE